MQPIFSLQVLRALAAFAVALSHAQYDLTHRLGLADALPSLALGSAGVDVFFVISGFIMVHASERMFAAPGGPWLFLKRRLIRIVPLYWAVTTLYLLIALVLPQLPHKDYSATMIACSYLFLPCISPDGFSEPVVGQGWTLNYEMLFYVLFGLAITQPRRRAVLLVAVALGLAVAAGKLFALPMPLSFWANEIVLEFVFGMALGLIYARGVRLSRWTRVLMIGVGLAVLGRSFADENVAGLYRLLTWGLPAALIVGGAVLGARSGPWPGAGWLGLVGDASYALYLIHPLAGRAVRELFVRSQVDLVAHAWVFLAVTAAATVAVAVIVYLWFERPITRALRDRFEARKPPGMQPQRP